ncbi:MAG: glucose-6-phosphate isomerase, partial [Dehalococcoidia bacterium]
MKEQRTSYRAGLGNYASKVEAALGDIQNRDLVKRIWAKDHTVWRPDPTEITNRLGWLTVTDTMREQVADLEAFAQEIRNTGFQHVVLLGMGGSSLGPEVLRQTIGPIPGYPHLIVLDSTLPSWIQPVTDSIDPKRTLFLVSSKSGATLETLSFYRYFRGLVEERAGPSEAGQNFVAITDPGTSLEKLAQEQGFRDAFLNPEDIGGRYSVLSFFGLVPATLTGVDIGKLMDRADSMRKECDTKVPVRENPGVWLGVVMGALALEGRDKLTLVTSPAIESFGLWVEQLLAESIGKEGKGIIPIAGEPLVAPGHYGEDRLFVFLRLEGDDNAAVDRAMDIIASSG